MYLIIEPNLFLWNVPLGEKQRGASAEATARSTWGKKKNLGLHTRGLPDFSSILRVDWTRICLGFFYILGVYLVFLQYWGFIRFSPKIWEFIWGYFLWFWGRYTPGFSVEKQINPRYWGYKFIPIQKNRVITHVCFVLFIVCYCICVRECLLQDNNHKTKHENNTISKQHSYVRGPLRECRSIRSGASGEIFILQNLILHARSCRTGFITQSSWFFHFHLTTLVRWKYFVPQLYQIWRGISGCPALK